MIEYLSVGYVLKPKGIKGEIKVQPLTDDIKRFDKLHSIYLKSSSGYRNVNILDRSYAKGFVFLKLEGFESIEQAELLRRQYLWISRDMALPLPKDTFYIADLINCSVETTNGRELGQVQDVIQTGSNDVLTVYGDMGEILIPLLKKAVKKVDLKERKIIVIEKELEGLLPNDV